MSNNRSLGYIVLLIIVIGGFIFFTQKSSSLNTQFINNDSTIVKIDELTREAVVVAYVKKHQQLPDYYITKYQARRHGWDASSGNLCDVLPGRAIGGDVFSNREKSLPSANNRKWFEADLNYNCGRRNADRLLFSSDGLVYVTYDHYKTFTQK